MGLVLDSSRKLAENWIDAGRGVELKCRPVTFFLVAAARARAEQLVVDLKAAGEAVTKAGGRIEGVPDLSSAAEAGAVFETLVTISLAELVVTDWRNVLDADGRPIDFRADLLSELLTDSGVADALRIHCLRPLYERRAEGNA